MHADVEALIERSRRLGADRRVTNFGGGNTSVKVGVVDPVTGDHQVVLFVKGSGGDLGTLTEPGLASLVLDRVVSLEATYRRGVSEADLVDHYRYCTFGDGGAVPSIDTPLHALVPAAHVDHLHPETVIALATARDGEALVAECFGGDIGWLPWKRPGFELALMVRDFCAMHPAAHGVVLGGHGLMCWGDTTEECEERSLAAIRRAEQFLVDRGRADPLGGVVDGFEALPSRERSREAAQLAPIIRGLCSTDRRIVASLCDDPLVLDFLSREATPRLAALGTSCPDHFLRTKVRPLFLDLPPGEPFERRVARLRELHAAYRAEYSEYYQRHATQESPPMRAADPAIVLVPGVGMWSVGPDAQSARVAGEFYLNAINVMRGAESVSQYVPIPEGEKFGIEYWELEERKLGLRPPARPLEGKVAIVTGAGSGIGRAVAERFEAEGACVVVADIDREAAGKVAGSLGDESTLACTMDVTSETAVEAAFDAAARRFGGIDIVVNSAGLAAASPLTDTSLDEWERLHAVLARGAFLVSRAAARLMITQALGGDIVHVVSKNAVVAGPQNIAYSAAKADQAHQVRLLAAELGGHGIRVNGVSPDGVVRGSGIFSGEWLHRRADAYGVEPESLGEFYAERTLLGVEVWPEHVADAVFSLVGGQLSRTTGLVVPVDGGLPAAFLR